MKKQISKFTIRRLHGIKDYELRLYDNKLILIGENGSGKTTVLRLLYYFLDKNWVALSQYNFKSLTIELENREKISLDGRKLRVLDVKWSKKSDSEQILWNTSNDMLGNKHFIDIINSKLLIDNINHKNIKDIESYQELLEGIGNQIDKQLAPNVLYLPTYRRIEQELNKILKGYVQDKNYNNRVVKQKEEKNSVELVEFGMKDVDDAIQETVDNLVRFAHMSQNELTLGYLGQVVDKQYLEIDLSKITQMSENEVVGILDKINLKILSIEQKEKIHEIINHVRAGEFVRKEHAKLVCHYFLKLREFIEKLKDKQSSIICFCNVCNQYLVDKKLSYNDSDFTFKIQSTLQNCRPIELAMLSSGEKQIVSLFSHLYLKDSKKYFVMIDEPELSLSVTWQERFLPDIVGGDFCSGLVAVTHSPFIFNNNLKSYARSLGEFII